MKSNIVKILWGIVLVIGGGLLLAATMGYITLDLTNTQVWSIIFVAIGAAFFLSYLLSGARNWGWLFPALIFAALALVTQIIPENPDGQLIALPIILSIAIPFYVGYALERKHWGLLIPAWIMTVVSVILVLSERANSDLIGSFFLFAIALPFIIAYLANRQHKWSLIVGVVMACVGLLPLIASMSPAEATGPVIMFLFALTFCIIYFATKNQWWAILPAGIFASIGVVALLDILFPNPENITVGNLEFGAYTGVLLLGFAATLGILWLLRGSQPTSWAKIPAIVILIASMIAFLWWATLNNLVPAVILLVLGAALIITSVLKRQGAHQPSASPLFSSEPGQTPPGDPPGGVKEAV
jgi:hypothetical protein